MFRRTGAVLRCALFGFVTLAARISSAQNSSAAEELYRRGVEDFRAGRLDVACREIAESYRMEELPGVLFTLATCEARAGRVASAVAHFEDFLGYAERLSPAQRLAQREREDVAKKELVSLRARVPRIGLDLDARLPDHSRVELDGTPLGQASFETRLPVDPGTHEIVVTLPSGETRATSFEVNEGDAKRIVVRVPSKREMSEKPVETGLSPWTIGFGAGAGLGFATSIGAGIVAIVEKSTVDAHCREGLCDSVGLAASESGKNAALVSTIGASVGAATLVSAVVIELFRSSPEPDGDTAIVLRGTTLHLEGSF